MWANAACTERPIVGQSYTQLYVRIGRAFGFNDSKRWDEDEAGQCLYITTPSTEEPEDTYLVNLWVDWFSVDGTNPYEAGQIVEVTSQEAIPVTSDFVFDFYDE